MKRSNGKPLAILDIHIELSIIDKAIPLTSRRRSPNLAAMNFRSY